MYPGFVVTLEAQQSIGKKQSSGIGTGILAIIALFAPASLLYSTWSTQIIAMTWYFTLYVPWDYYYPPFIDPFFIVTILPFTFLRPIFVLMFSRLYKGKTTRRRVFTVGIITELEFAGPFYFIMLLQYIVYPYPYMMTTFAVPIPLLLATALVFMKIRPPPQDKLWIEEAKSQYWWETPTKQEPQTPTENDTWLDGDAD